MAPLTSTPNLPSYNVEVCDVELTTVKLTYKEKSDRN